MTDAHLQRLQLGGDRRARAELVRRYLPLARSLAARYRNRGEAFDDLVQVASVGLLKALNGWDPGRGSAFATYAVPTILGELRRYFRDHTWMVRPPRATQELALAICRLGAQPDGHGATVAEAAAALGRSEEDVREAIVAIAGRYAESRETLTAAGDEAPTALDLRGEPEPGYDRVEQAMLLDDLLSALDERAREVVDLAYREDLLQREIAERVGCSQMHVSRILRESLNRMRLHARRGPELGLAA